MMASSTNRSGIFYLLLFIGVLFGLIGNVHSLHCYTCDSAIDPQCSARKTSDESTHQLHSCSATSENEPEACYTRILTDGTVRRGCLAAEPEAVQRSCLSGADEACIVCSSNGCNREHAELNVCIVCDSATEANCATGANLTAAVHQLEGHRCALSQQVGCYRYETNDGNIKRGCASDLTPAEFRQCDDSNGSDTCKTCRGPNCNEKPTFQYCHSCDSRLTPQCAAEVASLPTVLCAAYTDECYTYVHDDVIVRGCLSELDAVDAALLSNCSEGARLDGTCERCKTPGCNDAVVRAETCVFCRWETDPNCSSLNVTNVSNNTNNLVTCPLAIRPLGCYLYDDGDGVVVRGCVSQLDSEGRATCDEQGDYCKTCSGDGCNSRVSFQTCQVCKFDGDSGTECIRSADAAESRVCREYADECVTHVRGDLVTRGCLSELMSSDSRAEDALSVDCSAAEGGEFCERCSGSASCNSRIVDGEFCLSCDSEEDENCRSNTNFTMRVQCPLGVVQRGCYRTERGDRVKRGCVASLELQEASSCRSGDAGCKTCTGNDCNAQTQFKQCRVCSSRDSLNCIWASDSFPTVTCHAYTDACFVHVQDDIVTRGCLQEHLPAGANATSICTTSSEEGACNDRVVAGEFCLECNSQVDENCSRNANQTMRKQCPLSVEPHDGCYMFDDGESIVKRGCVGDLIAAEREMCERQGNECKTCHGNDCNAHASFQKCHVCDSTVDVSCVKSPDTSERSQKVCQAMDDECYTHVTADNAVVRRGCLKEALPSVQASCATHPEVCERCSGDAMCNGRQVNEEFCLTCDSTVDVHCATAPNLTMSTRCPLTLQPLGCYHFVNGGGAVKRGCVADLKPFEQQMCVAGEQPEVCKTCAGSNSNCNSKLEFERCKRCNSMENIDCIRYVKNYIEAKVCEHYDDQCFTHVRGNVTTRGCLAESPTEVRNDCTDPEVCNVCSSGTTEACNDQIIDGEFCFACDTLDDPECRHHVTLSMRKQCSLAVTPLGCYDRKNSVTKRVQRGCVSDLSVAERNACNTAEDCKICTGDECNKREELATCAVCDSVSNDGCVTMIGAGNTLQVCPQYDDRCFTRINGTEVTRGCVGTLLVDAFCAPDDSSCQICDGVGCNRLNLEPESCYVCSTDSDPHCAGSLTHLDPQPCSSSSALGYTFNRAGCYHTIDEDAGRAERGCVNSLPMDLQQRCSYQLDCKTCADSNGCNKRGDFQKCYACDSLYDPMCVGEVSEYLVPAVCIRYEDRCTQLVTRGGVTWRGCAGQADAWLLGEALQLEEECAENVCNGGVFPVDRWRCHQCSGAECVGELSPANDTLMVCAEYVREDFCYGFLDAQGLMHRGCHSDKTPQKRLCDDAGSECIRCDRADGCNSQAGIRSPNLSCIQCSDAEACAWGHQANASMACTEPVIYGRSELCYTSHMPDGTTTRGCANDHGVQDCAIDAKSCTFCSGAACNRRNATVQTCQRCNSTLATEAACGEEDVQVFVGQCPLIDGAVLEFEDRGCYTRNEGGEITRGCLSELSAGQYEKCLVDGEKRGCELCLDQNCNTKAPPSSARSLMVMAAWWPVLILSSWMVSRIDM